MEETSVTKVIFPHLNTMCISAIFVSFLTSLFVGDRRERSKCKAY
jgi:hypothetical protein